MQQQRTLIIILAVTLFTLCVRNGRAAEPSALARRISAAPAGMVIRIPAGIHRVHLRLDKPITLIGERGAVLDGRGEGDVIRIAASGVTVKGLTIRNSGRDLSVMNAGIFVEQKAHDVVISNNRLDEVLFGIYLDGAAKVEINGNRIRGIKTLRRPDRGDGIHMWNDTHVEVRDNDIGDTRDGIYLYISPHSRIIDNRIHDVRYGVHYMYSNHDRLAFNQTYRNTAGYALMQSDHLEIVGNRSTDDQEYGILVNFLTYSKFTGNVVRRVEGTYDEQGRLIPGGEGKGIFLYNSEYNRLYDNTIEACRIGIHVTAGSKHNEIYHNRFLNNRRQVKYVQNARVEWSVNGVGNYWSDYLGWDLDGDGKGDLPYRPSDGVDILLWKYPGARLLMNSPAILALRYIQRIFPVFMPPSAQDSHPLMRQPHPWSGRQTADGHARSS